MKATKWIYVLATSALFTSLCSFNARLDPSGFFKGDSNPETEYQAEQETVNKQHQEKVKANEGGTPDPNIGPCVPENDYFRCAGQKVQP